MTVVAEVQPRSVLGTLPRCPVCQHPGELAFRLPERAVFRCPACDLRWIDLPDSIGAMPFDFGHYTTKMELRGWRFEASVREYTKWFGQLPHRPGDRFLEIGPGNGEVLEAGRRLGLRCTGFDVDPSVTAIPHHADVELISGRFEVSRFANQFDIVFSNNVLEHIPQPLEFLGTAFDLLRPGAHMWVSCPNAASYEAKILGPYWPQYSPLDHVRMYSPKAIRGVMLRAGFELARIWTAEADFDVLALAAGLRNFLVRHRGAPLSAVDYGRGSAVPRTRAMRVAVKAAFQLARLPGAPLTLLAPAVGLGAHLRALVRRPRGSE